MKYIRKYKKISISIMIVLILVTFFGFSFARYIYNSINNFILESKDFYFNSSILSMNTANYNINNWDGVSNYELTIDVNNKKDELKTTPDDIDYAINVECPSTVKCSTNKETGTIYEAAKSDSYIVTITPQSNFYSGDSVTIETSVTSTYPYKKTLSAQYTIGVEKNSFSYNIEDSKGSKYLTLNLTNSISYYEVETAFTVGTKNYKVGEQVSSDVYNTLSSTNKSKCFSAEITLTFPPNDLYLDMTSSTYKNRLVNKTETTSINNFNYISKYSFKINSSTSEKVMFYKRDIDQNYTYPITNQTPVITVVTKLAK